MAADPSRNLKLEENHQSDHIPKPIGTLARRVTMEGYLLKRSETLRRWNQRWFSLDPTTAKMEYRTQRDELQPRGYIVFDVESTVTVSPINFQGSKEYEGCSFYIGTPRKKEYYLCAETPAAARAWVATIRAACLVLAAHKDAVSSLTDSGRTAITGAVKAAAAQACAVASSHAKDIAISNQKAVMNPHQHPGSRLSGNAALMKMASEGSGGSPQGPPPAPASVPVESDQEKLAVMKETMRVKDEELQHLVAELRARDATIRDMALRLSQTAQAAEAASKAAHDIDRNRSAAVAKISEICKQAEEKLEAAAVQVRAASERESVALAERDRALAEAASWRREAELAREDVRQLALPSAPAHALDAQPVAEAAMATLAIGIDIPATSSSSTPAAAAVTAANGIAAEAETETEKNNDSRSSSDAPPPLPTEGAQQPAEDDAKKPIIEAAAAAVSPDTPTSAPALTVPDGSESFDEDDDGGSPGAMLVYASAPFPSCSSSQQKPKGEEKAGAFAGANGIVEGGDDMLEGLDLDVDFLKVGGSGSGDQESKTA